MKNKIDGITTLLEKLLLAERLRALNSFEKEVWFDNCVCKLFIPDALDDRIQSIILNSGSFFEEGLLRKVRKFLDQDSIVIDAGANIGNHTMFFSIVCHAKHVFAFEPQLRLVRIIQRNIEINGLDERHITVFPVGLGDRSGSLAPIKRNLTNMGATQFAYEDSGAFNVQTIDDFNIQNVSFMKIDVERMGDSVLRGAMRTIERSSPIIWIELYGDEENLARAELDKIGYNHFAKLTSADWLFSRSNIRI